MGNPKQKWTSEEEEALRAGVNKHGVGKWKLIQKDPEFNHLLYSRSNIDLKDKWRNLFSNGHGPRDKSRIPKAMGEQTETPATPVLVAQMPASITPSSQDDASIDVVMVDSSTDVVMVDSSSPLPEGHNAAKYNAMIYETLSTLNQPNGSDFNGIANFIEQRQEVPHKFRRILSSRLRKLVLQGKLEKVQNCYKINKDAPLDTKKPASLQKEVQPSPRAPVPINAYVAGDSLEEAAVTAAYRIAEAENKSFVAAEAGKEAERVATMAEEMEALLQFATYCFEQCERGEILLKA